MLQNIINYFFILLFGFMVNQIIKNEFNTVAHRTQFIQNLLIE